MIVEEAAALPVDKKYGDVCKQVDAQKPVLRMPEAGPSAVAAEQPVTALSGSRLPLNLNG